jgi:hypothetical protein
MVAYKTKFQPTVALSSMEAEFMAAVDVSQMCLFVQSIFWPKKPLPLHMSTMAVVLPWAMPRNTTRTRHINIKYFALCNWVEQDLVILERIDTSINIADHLTKILSHNLFQ